MTLGTVKPERSRKQRASDLWRDVYQTVGWLLLCVALVKLAQMVGSTPDF